MDSGSHRNVKFQIWKLQQVLGHEHVFENQFTKSVDQLVNGSVTESITIQLLQAWKPNDRGCHPGFVAQLVSISSSVIEVVEIEVPSSFKILNLSDLIVTLQLSVLRYFTYLDCIKTFAFKKLVNYYWTTRFEKD